MSSKYGVKIKNIEASTLYEYNLGVREYFESKNAMFTNSLFKDYIENNGLRVEKGYTKDIICLEFNFGTDSYATKRKKCLKKAKDYRKNKTEEGIRELREKNIRAFLIAKKNKDKLKDIDVDEIRSHFYKNGIDIKYVTRKKNGEIKKEETIHYLMLYRSTGKAKKGSCMFIRDKLHKKALNFLRMGVKLPKENPPIVEIGAYAPLTASTIVGKVKINPKNILILKDIDSFFQTKIVSVELNDKKQCLAKNIENYQLKNTMFDGQALIDSSIFPNWADGYVLLRHHFCKMASFCCHIQKFFKDYYGEQYHTAKVKDMFGNEHFVKDIELITTDNAMKWLKFDISYEYWCDRVYENNCMFGIVKTAHESKLGAVQKMSYQMVNSLNLNIMPNVVKESVEYVNQIKKDNEVFINYLKDNANFFNDYEALVALCEQNWKFTRSQYFRERKKEIVRTYIKKLKSGKIIQNADNLVLVGSPYAMLLYTVGDDIEKDVTLVPENGVIQCYTERFDNDEYLCGFRSPHNSPNNIIYMHNVHSDEMHKYFNLGKQILAVNVRNTDIQDRANGCDFDSDSFYVTNQKDIVQHAKECYINFPTIVNNIPKEQNKYENTMEDFAKVDNNLAKAQKAIGGSSNLAQLCLTYTYNFNDKKYIDYVCLLSVLAQCAIDNAKRRFDCDINAEIDRIKKDMNIKTNGYPKFWKLIKGADEFNKNKINKELVCPMNFLFDLKFEKFRSSESTLPMNYFFEKFELDVNRKTCKKVEELIQKYSFDLFKWSSETDNDSIRDGDILLRNDFDDLIEDLRITYLSNNYLGLMSWLLDRCFMITPATNRNKNSIITKLNMNKSILFATLFKINSKNFIKCWSKNS